MNNEGDYSTGVGKYNNGPYGAVRAVVEVHQRRSSRCDSAVKAVKAVAVFIVTAVKSSNLQQHLFGQSVTTRPSAKY